MLMASVYLPKTEASDTTEKQESGSHPLISQDSIFSVLEISKDSSAVSPEEQESLNEIINLIGGSDRGLFGKLTFDTYSKLCELAVVLERVGTTRADEQRNIDEKASVLERAEQKFRRDLSTAADTLLDNFCAPLDPDLQDIMKANHTLDTNRLLLADRIEEVEQIVITSVDRAKARTITTISDSADRVSNLQSECSQRVAKYEELRSKYEKYESDPNIRSEEIPSFSELDNARMEFASFSQALAIYSGRDSQVDNYINNMAGSAYIADSLTSIERRRQLAWVLQTQMNAYESLKTYLMFNEIPEISSEVALYTGSLDAQLAIRDKVSGFYSAASEYRSVERLFNDLEEYVTNETDGYNLLEDVSLEDILSGVIVKDLQNKISELEAAPSASMHHWSRADILESFTEFSDARKAFELAQGNGNASSIESKIVTLVEEALQAVRSDLGRDARESAALQSLDQKLNKQTQEVQISEQVISELRGEADRLKAQVAEQERLIAQLEHELEVERHRKAELLDQVQSLETQVYSLSSGYQIPQIPEESPASSPIETSESSGITDADAVNELSTAYRDIPRIRSKGGDTILPPLLDINDNELLAELREKYTTAYAQYLEDVFMNSGFTKSEQPRYSLAPKLWRVDTLIDILKKIDPSIHIYTDGDGYTVGDLITGLVSGDPYQVTSSYGFRTLFMNALQSKE